MNNIEREYTVTVLTGNIYQIQNTVGNCSTLHVSTDEAMNALKVPEADRSKYMERLSESQ